MTTTVRAKKHLGQHFLTDLNIARKIAGALSGGSAEAPVYALEVGPGMGVLTQFLLEREDLTTYAAEIDMAMHPLPLPMSRTEGARCE